ncbi:hypothetical protein ACQ4PT_049069 [Festuca glaucescens]
MSGSLCAHRTPRISLIAPRRSHAPVLRDDRPPSLEQDSRVSSSSCGDNGGVNQGDQDLGDLLPIDVEGARRGSELPLGGCGGSFTSQHGGTWKSKRGSRDCYREEAGTSESKENIDDMLNLLQITEEEGDAVDLSGLVEETQTGSRWAILMRVCMTNAFSHAAFYAAMQSAWDLANEVTFRSIDDFTFTAQFKCFGDWKTAMHGGPWLFRRKAVIIEEYNGLMNTETIPLDSIRVWVRIMVLD